MENLKNKFKKYRTALSLFAMTALTCVPVFAETSSVSSTITASFQQVVTDTLASIAAVAPIAITIFGAMFVWKKSKNFFSTITK